MIRVLVVAALALILLDAATASAHDARPGVLSLVEREPGIYDLRLVEPVDRLGDAVELTIELPPACARTGAQIRCRTDLTTLTLRGMRGDTMRTIVVLERRDGRRTEWIASTAEPRVVLAASPPRTWPAWIRLGIAHILGGLDHLAFVLGLLLVLGAALDRRLLLTITAFTIAHSLTLALATLGVVHVASAPVEACIAASIVLVAREATHDAPTALRRWPWLAAAGFGLLHGLGFASALTTVGLPRTSLASTLLAFNIGVELGQLAVVLAALALAKILRPGPRLHRAACYLLGGVATYWLFARFVTLLAV
jgi:hypothetical protein